jgi:pimeloyl-ACP methyl ester carboxylesterase
MADRNEERREHRVVANGLELRVLEWAPQEGPQNEYGAGAWSATALLLHGYMDAAATWQKVAGHFARAGLRVLAPDLRGYGDSARAPEGAYYHFPDYVADVADLVQKLVGKTPLFLVGHSMGGTIASLFAGAFPENVTKLALLEGLGPPDSDPDGMPDRMKTWIEQIRPLRGARTSRPVGTREDALRRLAANHPGVPRDVLEAHLVELVRDAGDSQVTWKADPLHKTVSPMSFFARGYIAFARRVTCPVLYVSGGKTGFHPVDTEERLAAFTALERFEIDDAGHMMHWTRAEPVAERLLAFWSAPR